GFSYRDSPVYQPSAPPHLGYVAKRRQVLPRTSCGSYRPEKINPSPSREKNDCRAVFYYRSFPLRTGVYSAPLSAPLKTGMLSPSAILQRSCLLITHPACRNCSRINRVVCSLRPVMVVTACNVMTGASLNAAIIRFASSVIVCVISLKSIGLSIYRKK